MKRIYSIFNSEPYNLFCNAECKNQDSHYPKELKELSNDASINYNSKDLKTKKISLKLLFKGILAEGNLYLRTNRIDYFSFEKQKYHLLFKYNRIKQQYIKNDLGGWLTSNTRLKARSRYKYAHTTAARNFLKEEIGGSIIFMMAAAGFSFKKLVKKRKEEALWLFFEMCNTRTQLFLPKSKILSQQLNYHFLRV